MKIRLHNSSVFCYSGGESILLSCARAGIMLPAPCGACGRCGKCRVKLLLGRVSGDTPDADGMILACRAVPVSDITIALPGSEELSPDKASDPACEETAESFENRRLSFYGKIAKAGIAIDIGTTTVSARLLDLASGTALETSSELNDQRSFGADVMSRIAAAKSGRTKELFNAINRQTERIINTFRERWGLTNIEKIAVSANTVMLHLFLNIDPSPMGEFPFTPAFLEEREIPGAELSLSTEKVITLPSISAFIGSDVVAGLAVLDLIGAGIPSLTDGPSLYIDIGTNGEMALANNGKFFCCSTAAGPVFEGAEISCGMGGVSGAISAVECGAVECGAAGAVECTEVSDAAGAVECGEAPPLQITTIGNVPPRGICGSGLIDAMAVMLKLGIVDETGLMSGAEKKFNLAEGISISGADVRQFQLAKSAILSGIKILCRSAGFKTADMKNVFIAGALGFYINKKNAVVSGLLPGDFLDRITVTGNLSLQGAEECLYDGGSFLKKCRQIIKCSSLVDLAADPAFMDEFAENMLFK